jgi:hypothetical protein
MKPSAAGKPTWPRRSEGATHDDQSRLARHGATATFLLVDHHVGVFERVVKSPPRDQVEMNVQRLGRAAAILDMPLIFATSEEDGPNGTVLPSLKVIQPAAYYDRIDRHGVIDSLADTASLGRSRRPAGAP